MIANAPPSASERAPLKRRDSSGFSKRRFAEPRRAALSVAETPSADRFPAPRACARNAPRLPRPA